MRQEKKKERKKKRKKEINRPLFQSKMKSYVNSVEDPNYLKHGETFFRNWQDLEVSSRLPFKQKETAGSAKRRQIESLLAKEDDSPLKIVGEA